MNYGTAVKKSRIIETYFFVLKSKWAMTDNTDVLHALKCKFLYLCSQYYYFNYLFSYLKEIPQWELLGPYKHTYVILTSYCHVNKLLRNF